MQMLTIALSQNGCMLSVMLCDLKNDPAFWDPFAAFCSQLSNVKFFIQFYGLGN